MKLFVSNCKKSLLAMATLFVASVSMNAMAATGDIDTTAIVGYATAAGVAVSAVGIAILGVLYGKKVYSWLRPS